MKVFFVLLLLSSNVFAWGGKGHDLICHAAVHAVKNKKLKEFLSSREHIMGHLCNIPDIYWRGLGGEANQLGSPTHFIDVEITGMKVSDIPNDFKKIVTDFTGKKNQFKEGTIYSVPTEFGSNWWRADQFFRLATESLKEAKAGSPEDKNENSSYNKGIYNFIVNAGLMGHFVGDNSQPFHTSADYDGWNSGHGGIHGYYEEGIVAAADQSLYAKIVAEALKIQKSKPLFLTAKTPLEKMKALGEISNKDMKKILALDIIKTKSTESDEHGMKKRVQAVREPAEKVFKKFEPLLITHMGRAVASIANMWDNIYIEAGEPDLTAYRSFKYPLTPDFVAPDYFDTKAEMTNKK
jgi:hypothetical protein